jgi:DNA sulfur modification protein DndE
VPVENIRLSQQGRDQLVRIRRHTGISNWNIMCRWAFCTSLAEDSPPPQHNIPADSTVEMTWRTFGGELDEVYRALILERLHAEGDRDGESDGERFRQHLHRGIGYLAGNPKIRSIAGLIQTALDAQDTNGDDQDSN